MRLQKWQRGTEIVHKITRLHQSITWLYQAIFVKISTRAMWDTWEGSKWRKRGCKSTTTIMPPWSVFAATSHILPLIIRPHVSQGILHNLEHVRETTPLQLAQLMARKRLEVENQSRSNCPMNVEKNGLDPGASSEYTTDRLTVSQTLLTVCRIPDAGCRRACIVKCPTVMS